MKNIDQFYHIRNNVVKHYLKSKQVYSIGLSTKALNDITLMSIAFVKFRLEDLNDDVIKHVSDTYLELYSDEEID